MTLNHSGDYADTFVGDMTALGKRCGRNRLLTCRGRLVGNLSQCLCQIFDAFHQRADNREVMPAMFADNRFFFDLFSAKRAFHEGGLSLVTLTPLTSGR